METYRNVQDLIDNDLQTANQPISLAQYSQTHPYQYLKQLNNVYQNCNKSAGKDYSSASMIKLPWKKFKQVTIPKCFQDSYNLQRKQTCVLKNSDDNNNSQEVQKQRKFWKDHEQLMKKYYRSNIVNSNINKQKMQERRKNLFSAKSCITANHKNSQSFIAKNNKNINQSSFKFCQNKQNNEQRYHTLNTQSDQTQSVALCQSKQFISNHDKNKPYLSSTNLLRQTTNSSSLVKKRLQKSKCFNQQMPVEQQVLLKLKKISMMPHLNRAKTANLLSRQAKCYRDRQKLEGSYKKAGGDRQSIRESRVKQGEYLQYNLKQQLIARYKSKIKEIDCSISQKNVKKTAQILKQMQQLVTVNIEDY